MTTAESTMFLCYPPEGECLNCGGSARVGIFDEHGRLIGTTEPWECDHGTYCSEDCLTEAGEFIARQKAWYEHQKSNWCGSCGYDNWEHADDCPLPPADRPTSRPEPH